MQRPPGEVWNSWQFTAAAKVMVACWLWPFRVAVTMAFWLPLTLPEIALNVALLWPAGTVTLGGTESNGLLLAIDTTESVVAAASKLTAHFADTPLVIAEGEQNSDVGRLLGAPWALSVKLWEPPLRVAVSRAV
jgi:hypothetical protein